jgi:hypothetical protein
MASYQQGKMVTDYEPVNRNNVEHMVTTAVLNDYWTYLMKTLESKPDIITKEQLDMLKNKSRMLSRFKAENEPYIETKRFNK